MSVAIAKHYLLTYPDGSKHHINRGQRDELLLASQIKLTAPLKYLFIGQIIRMRSLAELSRIRDVFVRRQRQEPNYYPGKFIVEFIDKFGSRGIRTERLESSENMVLRLGLAREAD